MEDEFKIGQKVMITEPVKEEDRFRVGTVVGIYSASNNYYVRFDEEEEPNGWHASRLTLLPECLQGKTQEEAERTVKAVRKAVETIRAMGKACKDTAEEMLKASEAFKQEADRQKRNEHIALELVKAWVGQDGEPASFGRVMDNYFDALYRLNTKIKP